MRQLFYWILLAFVVSAVLRFMIEATPLWVVYTIAVTSTAVFGWIFQSVMQNTGHRFWLPILFSLVILVVFPWLFIIIGTFFVGSQ